MGSHANCQSVVVPWVPWGKQHQRKIQHLQAKDRDCSRHQKCREIDKLVADRLKKWIEVSLSSSSSPSPQPQQPSQPTMEMSNPPTLHSTHQDDSMDNANIDKEEVRLLK